MPRSAVIGPKPTRIEQKRAYRARKAAREGRVFRPGIPGRVYDQALVQARREKQRLEREAKRDRRSSIRVQTIAAKPWLDPSLSHAQSRALRYRLDPGFNLRQRLRAAFRRRRQGIKLGDLLRDALVRNGRSPTATQFVGYSVLELRTHLERQFTKGMDWERFCAGDIHIDHIIPLAKFDLSNVNELRMAWALTNLQPLWAADNIRKRDRIISLI